MKYLIALSLLVASNAFADHLVLGFGPTLNGGINPKYGSLGYEYEFNFPMSLTAECGSWFSTPAGYACQELNSVRVLTPEGIFSRLGFGPAWIHPVDDRLSTPFEFSIQGAAGLEQDGWGVGIKYQHFSNAGIKQPNLGRDFLQGFVEIKL